MRPNSIIPAVAVLVLAFGAVLTARGDDDEIALQRALDQPLTLTLEKTPLSEAFKQIGAAAKITLDVDAAAYDALPYGGTTVVSADFRQSKLRDALEEILLPLGLQQTVSGNAVIIRPSSPLAHIGRKAEWEELKLLKELRTSPDIKAPGKGALDLTAAVRAVMDQRKDLTVSLANDAGALHDRAIDQIQKQLPMSAFRAIEMYCQLTNQIWFVEGGPLAGGETGGSVQIMSQRQWIQRQLERPIRISRPNAPLEQVVGDLTRASGIRFVPEPGLYQAVPVVSLSSSNGSVRQTLEALAGATRIAFDVREDSILLHLAPGPGNDTRSDTIIGRMSVPGPNGAQIDVFIRESDLPAETNDLLSKRRQEAVDALKIWLANPTTKPGGN